MTLMACPKNVQKRQLVRGVFFVGETVSCACIRNCYDVNANAGAITVSAADVALAFVSFN